MELSIRPLMFEERKYTYAQSQQLDGQTGSVGHLRGDFDSGGYGFFTTWFDHCRDLKTEEFKKEFDNVVNALRSEEYGLLQDRVSMRNFARQCPDSAMKGNYTTEYGFRVDTDQYSYLLRCNPTRGDYNFYLYAYKREWLDRHMERAGRDIRFIDSHYKDLFRLPDGEQIQITKKTGETMVRTCRYIDQTHVEVEDNLFHICEFAERMEQSGNTYRPKETPLPPMCFSRLPSTGDVIKIMRYRKGYVPMKFYPTDEAKTVSIDKMNDAVGVSKAQAAAMLAGSMFGWDCPAARPDRYDADGKAIHPKEKER